MFFKNFVKDESGYICRRMWGIVLMVGFFGIEIGYVFFRIVKVVVLVGVFCIVIRCVIFCWNKKINL